MPQPVRLGVLNDQTDIAPAHDSLTDWLHREIADLRAAGRLPVEVELVHAYGMGLPWGSAQSLERAYRELLDQDVALIIGPAIGDNALLATPWVERDRVPTINWSGAERARGEWMFHLQVGSHEDESLVMARHLAAVGCKRVAVIYDLSPIGVQHLKYLRDEARIVGLDIVYAAGIQPLAKDAVGEVRTALANDPDGFVYLGLGPSAPAVAKALAESGWQGPRIMNTAGLRGYVESYARQIDGWIYIDMYSNANRTLQALLERYGIAPQGAYGAAKAHDLARLAIEGIARAQEYTRAGIRTGLEQIKWLPAAEGEDGTLLGFGIQDRGALHGRYLVPRQWLDGRTVEVAKA